MLIRTSWSAPSISNWKATREAAIADGSTPSLSISTATEWAARDSPLDLPERSDTADAAAVQRGLFDEHEAQVPSDHAVGDRPHADVAIIDARGSERPGGLRFGELVHAMLAAVPLDAPRRDIDALAAVQGRVLAALPDEIAAAVETVDRVLRHDLLGRARAAEQRGACRRETPVTVTLTDGSMVEGVVDLAFEDARGWTIVDYKTDRELAMSGEDRYRRQVALYATAVSRATGAAAAGVLIRI